MVGTPVAGRMQEEWKETVGMFVNMIAMRNFPTFDRTYTDFLRELKQHTLDAFAYQEYPFNELVAQLGVTREFENSIWYLMFVLIIRTWTCMDLNFMVCNSVLFRWRRYAYL